MKVLSRGEKGKARPDSPQKLYLSLPDQQFSGNNPSPSSLNYQGDSAGERKGRSTIFKKFKKKHVRNRLKMLMFTACCAKGVKRTVLVGRDSKRKKQPRGSALQKFRGLEKNPLNTGSFGGHTEVAVATSN